MQILKEIAQGILAIVLIGALAVGVAAVAVNVTQPGVGTAPTENSHSGSDDEPELSFWAHHDLNAIPGLENATPSDLPTAEEVENILFEWDVFENERPPVMVNWTPKTFDEVFPLIKKLDLEYHFDENGRLHVDTPGWIYETPSERDDGEYWLANSTKKEGGGGSRNVLDFCRHLRKQGIHSGIAILETENAYPHSKVVVPVRSGLMYSYATGVERGGSWLGIWYAVNVKPGEDYPWSGGTVRIKNTDLYWCLGEGDYVEWGKVHGASGATGEISRFASQWSRKACRGSPLPDAELEKASKPLRGQTSRW